MTGIVQWAGNPGSSSTNVNDINPFGKMGKYLQEKIMGRLWGEASAEFGIDGDGFKGKKFLLQKYRTYSNQQKRLTNPTLSDGLDIVLQYDAKGYDRLEWIQTVITDKTTLDGKSRQPYNDYARWGEDAKSAEPPFYFPRDRLDLQKGDVPGYNVRFQDTPSRIYYENNYYFRAELSLMGYKDGRWHHIETFRYGYEVRNNVVMPYRFQRGQSPIYNSYYINQLNR